MPAATQFPVLSGGEKRDCSICGRLARLYKSDLGVCLDCRDAIDPTANALLLIYKGAAQAHRTTKRLDD